MSEPLRDPTSDGDAVGYLMHQAAAVGPQNSRERELSEKCAEYLRAVVERARAAEAQADLTGGPADE